MRYDVSFGLSIVEVKTHNPQGVDFSVALAGTVFGSDNSVFTLVGSNGVCSFSGLSSGIGVGQSIMFCGMFVRASSSLSSF
ncbi:hypothetical protein [Wolbachia endosymbiont of Frankliniella intonsa]|uniref:hypothetical protein n=1 Tax=Wolbachia endosymbiont of Frankliniella intonsa TaxID=2902422 RepID=UPI00244EF25F|nr:hypothetical protein [Wolbachia endosymbiont of Frankliniella intonsa]WGJ61964.1 hypothetical protein M3L71_06845 [Wolbachia endosymbiont of Frankliniella intonsa]